MTVMWLLALTEMGHRSSNDICLCLAAKEDYSVAAAAVHPSDYGNIAVYMRDEFSTVCYC